MVGTRVRDSRYDISIANTTASAIGTNSERAAPVRNAIGANTMQMQSVDTNAGTAICCAPSMIARVNGLCWCRLRWMFSIATVSAIGPNSERAAPVRNAIGANTMQMQSVDTNAGTAI